VPSWLGSEDQVVFFAVNVSRGNLDIENWVKVLEERFPK
jgi:hypothetical protein